MLAAVGVLAAVVGRGGAAGVRQAAGGQRVDISLLGATMASLVNQAQNAFTTGVAPGRLGNAHPNIVPYETFETADGSIAIAVGSERQWPRLCAALGVGELAADPRFATNGDRVENRAALRPLLAERFRARSNADWLDDLARAEIPCGPINDIVAAFDSPEAAALGDDCHAGSPSVGRDPTGGHPIRSFGDAGIDPDASTDPRRAHRRDPGEPGLRTSCDRRSPRPRGGLICLWMGAVAGMCRRHAAP